MRKLALMLLLPTIASLALVATAAAEKPITVETKSPHTATLDVCGFEIAVSWLQSGPQTFYYDEKTGELKKIIYHVTEQDTFTNELNGKSITGEPYSYTFHVTFPGTAGDPPSVYATGQVERLTIPGVTVFHSAGRINWSPGAHPEDFLIVPDMGVSGDIDAFCAYFADPA
jgi:hypothetical protein